MPLWQGPLMPRSSRPVLIRAVLTSIPIYILMSERLPPWVIEEFERYLQALLLDWGRRLRPRQMYGQLDPSLQSKRVWRTGDS